MTKNIPMFAVIALLFLVTSFLVILPLEAVSAADSSAADIAPNLTHPDAIFDFKAQIQKRAHREVDEIRGIYLPPSSPYLQHPDVLLERLRSSRINAVVIDVKGDKGHLLYDSRLPIARRVEASKPLLDDLEAVVQRLLKNGVFPIARVVTFKDNVMAMAQPQWAVQRPGGHVWRDRKGMAWLNPYHRKAWEYNLKVAKEAAAMGFREIQFDYVRFPTDGQVSLTRYPTGSEDFAAPDDAIASFLRRAKEELNPAGVYVSADVFGLVPSVKDDMGIGQKWEKLVMAVDFICPMSYPSHYGRGVYGLVDPDSEPYETVSNTLQDGLEKMQNLEGQDLATVRPWLQDFSMRASYGKEEVRAQIRAVEERGPSQWLLWNPHGVYTWEALLRED